ncbi:MAG: SUMF1/EgtB/PvdO family nonheme iron enzyme [Nitrospinae bacterium]|nr:SUMF1/EgtB/PvdO family nonheme iron enzyme [Nitrospinota bacterium]
MNREAKKRFSIFISLLFTGLIIIFSQDIEGFGDAPPQDMVEIHAGVFTMGVDIENEQEWGDVDEEPLHEVYLSKYYIDRYEVTAAQFADFLNKNMGKSERYIDLKPAVTIEKVKGKLQARKGLENYPANRVSWYGADAYCKEQGKRLPTEAEWEQAAKGPDGRVFPWGDEAPDNTRVTYKRKFNELGFKAMEPVDSMEKGRSPYGLHHMAGNVWEWVADWYDEGDYSDTRVRDPQGPEEGTTKVLRGGNWYYRAYYLRTTYRFNEKPDAFKIWQGFRCAKTP